MHNPCCPVLLEAVCARSPLKQFKEILLLAVAACELPAATMLAVQLILHSFTIPQIIPSGACHSPGLQLARRRPFFLVAPRILHLADCAQFHVPGRDL